MEERKRWRDCKNSRIIFGGSTSYNNTNDHDAAPSFDNTDPVLEKQRQYIKILEERNRLRKKLTAQRLQKDKDIIHREESFTTTFNVPRKLSIDNRAIAKKSKRHNRSAGSTEHNEKLHPSAHNESKSAPNTIFKPRGKWEKPAGSSIAIFQTQKGKKGARFSFISLAQAEKQRNMEKGASSEEEYLEESFEEFSEFSDEAITRVESKNDACAKRKEAIDEEMQILESIAPIKAKDTNSSTPSIPAELLTMIKGLHVSQQKMLQQLLTNFATSDQMAQDVDTLRDSVSERNPELWKYVKSAVDSIDSESTVQDKLTAFIDASVGQSTLHGNMDHSKITGEPEGVTQCRDNRIKESESRRHSLLQRLAREEDEVAIQMSEKKPDDPGILMKTRTLTQSQSESILKPGRADSRRARDVPLLGISASTPFLEKVSSPRAFSEKIFDVRINFLSSWNSTRAVGLHALQILDATNSILQVDINRIRVSDQMLLEDTAPGLPRSLEMVRTVADLFPASTRKLKPVKASESKGWKGRIPEKSGGLQISFHVCSSRRPTWLRIFNSKDHSIATRDIEVIFQKKCVWTGSLQEPTTQNKSSEHLYCEIPLDPRSIRCDEKNMRTLSEAKMAHVDPLAASGESKWIPMSARDRKEKQFISSVKRADDPKATTRRSLPAWLSKESLNEDLSSTVTFEDDSKKSSDSPNLTSDNTRKVKRHEISLRKEKRFEYPVLDLMTRAKLDSSTAGMSDVVDSLENLQATGGKKIIDTSRAKRIIIPPTLESSTSGANVFLDGIRKRHQDEQSRPKNLCPSATNNQRHIDFDSRYCGNVLSLDIFSTWGDPHYVGLNGIEMFDEEGRIISDYTKISACPSSINDLEDYHDDPRVPANIVDGSYYTCDDQHMWLAPFIGSIEDEQKKPNTVRLEMSQAYIISMVRIWNYNKSRAHSSRGVRHIRMSLLSYDKATASKISSRTIFHGDIRNAPGIMCPSEVENCYEEIVLTKAKKVLEAIRQQDLSWKSSQEDVDFGHVHPQNTKVSRPRTSHKTIRSELKSVQEAVPNRITNIEEIIDKAKGLGTNERPMTNAGTNAGSTGSDISDVLEKSPKSAAAINPESKLYGRQISIHLMSTWGDRNYIGLTQIELLIGSQRAIYPLNINHIDARPRDLESLGHHGDPRTLDKVVDGVAHTTDDAHMWLVPYTLEAFPVLSISLPEDEQLFGLRIWNYNKSVDDSFRGVKEMRISIDNKWVESASEIEEEHVRRGCMIVRKAPGNTELEFDQTILFSRFQKQPYSIAGAIQEVKRESNRTRLHPYKSPVIRQDYESPYHPQGLILKFVCHATWGDPYYLGLNGMEIYGPEGKRVTAQPKVVTAKPYSVAEIQPDDTERDDRIPKNLFNGRNNTWEAQDSWLAPLASSLGKNSDTNVIYVVYDEPITISMVKIWNYSKTIERGVRIVSIFMDDLLIYFGNLKSAPATGAPQMARHYSSEMPTRMKFQVADDFGQPIFFTTLKHIVEPEKRKISYCGQEEQDVLCINEGQVMHASKEMHRRALDPSVEGITVDLALRPVTAMRG